MLAHVPGLVRHGSKPARELARDPELLGPLGDALRDFDAALRYPPNQVFIGAKAPDSLRDGAPWWQHPLSDAARFGPFGEIMPETEFYGLLKLADEFDLVWLEGTFAATARDKLRAHPLIGGRDLSRLGTGKPRVDVESKIQRDGALPLLLRSGEIVGCCRPDHEADASLTADVLLENLAAKASGYLALVHALGGDDGIDPLEIDYLLGCGEEAVGDRYQRGGGGLCKAMGEMAGCRNATGSDVKAFCCAPVHALAQAAAMVRAGLFRQVVVVGGGSLAKLGMKFRGHLAHRMPVLEDVLGAIAIVVGEDDGRNPVIRLDAVGKHDIGAGSSPQAIMESLVVRPLRRLDLRLTDIERYATEMHNPEVTEPAGSGNVPRTNYRMIASLAVMAGQIERSALDAFAEERGMPGFSPTQGHIAAAVPYLPHARAEMLAGRLRRAMFVAKGSFFLGRMTAQADGMSVVIEANPAAVG